MHSVVFCGLLGRSKRSVNKRGRQETGEKDREGHAAPEVLKRGKSKDGVEEEGEEAMMTEDGDARPGGGGEEKRSGDDTTAPAINTTSRPKKRAATFLDVMLAEKSRGKKRGKG